LIAPAPEGLLEIHPVSNAVNRTANDAPVLIEPAMEQPAAPAPVIPKPASKAKPKRKKDDGQGSLF
jgi:hypothetical protein